LGGRINEEGRRKRGRRPYTGFVSPATLNEMLGQTCYFVKKNISHYF
jgi:hypothetical protein